MFKVVLEIMEIFYSIFDGPLQKNYRKRVIPLGMEFYSNLRDDQLCKMNNLVKA